MARQTVRSAEEHLAVLEDQLAKLSADGGDPAEIAGFERLIAAYRANGIRPERSPR